jgi:hypothetical protein
MRKLILISVLALAGACSSPDDSKWQLEVDNGSDMYVLDHDQTLEDCASGARAVRSKWLHVYCSPQR